MLGMLGIGVFDFGNPLLGMTVPQACGRGACVREWVEVFDCVLPTSEPATCIKSNPVGTQLNNVTERTHLQCVQQLRQRLKASGPPRHTEQVHASRHRDGKQQKTNDHDERLYLLEAPKACWHALQQAQQY